MNLLDAMRAHGLLLSSFIISDEIERCGTIKKPKGTNGWYRIFEGGRAAIFGNWEHGDGYEYWSDGTITSVDYEKINAAIEKIQREREKKYSDAAIEALEYCDSLPDKGFSDYLKRKRLNPYGVKFDKDVVVIPLQDAQGKIWTYQRIYKDGSKYFMKGSRSGGCYYAIFPQRNVSKKERVIVCEGWATGATIHQETGLPVIVAFNKGNLKAVCSSIGFQNIVIAADNDENGGGEKAAKETGYPYVIPNVIGWDFSDVFLNGKSVSDYFTISAEQSSELRAHGIVGEIADWITATAIYPQPKLSIAAALAFVGTLKGHRYATSTDLRSNVLVLSMAPSASGKEHPQNCIDKLMKATGLRKHILGDPTSGSGFLIGLVEAQRIGLWIIDEIGRYLSNVMSKESQGFERQIIDYIMKSFSRANGTLVGKQFANPKINPRIDIDNPHFCCLGSTVKEKIIQACKSSDVIDGFLNRWILFSSDERPDENYENYSSKIPQELIDKIISFRPIERDSYGVEIIEKVEYSPEAADLMRDFRAKMKKKIAASEFPFDSLYGRSNAHAAKIAMIVADGNLIVCEDVRFAIKVVEQSNEAIMKFAGLISDNQFEADYIRVRELIAKHRVMKKNLLTRKTQFINGGQRRRDEIIRSLLESNIIAEQINGKETCYKFLS